MVRNQGVGWETLRLTSGSLLLQIQSGSGGITIETTENSSQLTIAASEQDHSGSYTVELQNKFGTKQASLNLAVVGMPHVHRHTHRGRNLEQN